MARVGVQAKYCSSLHIRSASFPNLEKCVLRNVTFEIVCGEGPSYFPHLEKGGLRGVGVGGLKLHDSTNGGLKGNVPSPRLKRPGAKF